MFAKLTNGRTPWIAVPVFAVIATLAVIAAPPSAAGLGLPEFWRYSLAAYLEYAIYACGFFMVFWVIAHRFLARRKLARQRWPQLSQIVRETVFSLLNQFVFFGIGIWLLLVEEGPGGKVYLDIGQYGWAYFGLVTFLLLFLDDTYFYWTHRAMHHPKLFPWFHRVHHESLDPTPFTAFSFHPLETVVLGIGNLAVLPVGLLLPVHPASFVVLGLVSIFNNMIQHLGYELYPSFWNRIPVLRWKTAGMHHYMHHQRVQGNYGLYFRWWDKLCGTEFKDYEARYDRLFAAPLTDGQRVGGG